MTDLINGRTPEEIKKWLNCLAFDCGFDMCGKCEYDELCKYPGTALLYAPDALALIEHLESERDAALAKVPKWIGVKEQLPEDCKDVLVWAVYHEKYGRSWALREVDAYCKGVGWENTEDPDVREVTHWMPLPEPPKEDE